MSRYLSIFWALGAVFLCANWSTQSTGGDEKPALDYSGEVTTDGAMNSVKNVTISGLIKDIPVYYVPKDQSENPTTNTTFISLDSIESIEPISTIPQQNVRRFNNRDFVEIKITFKNAAPDKKIIHFLVDRPRRIICEIVVGDSRLKKEILFEALGKLTIIGNPQARGAECKSCDAQGNTTKSLEKSAAQEALCRKAKDDLKNLESESKDNKGPIGKMVESVKNTVNYICG